MGGNDARQQVERNEPLGAGAVLVLGAVHRKGDADPAKNHLRLFAARPHHLAGLLRKPLVVALVVLPDRSPRIGQLLIHLIEFVHGTTNLLEA